MTAHTASRPPRRRTVALSAAALTLGVLATATAATASPADRTGHAPRTREIASAVLGSDYKVTLTALRSATDPYAASVRLQVFVHKGGAWKESDRVRVGGANSWFWYPLTGSHAVGTFSTASTEPAPVKVRLLITPSIGYSGTYAYVIRHGDITTR
ncbi:hypothetical protein C3489_22505 [Streptomyces sp. Ru71]|uniref:hypothetical protein n=1 Tax=Streptomyces sp. Ru71 TaxID=2080746 RepID=UPI000CDDFACC|nr:hypothetical protein [Streptomyces sp. Ru71]POX50421.1 hypothetical protein C3489_22505 [Streptomyces sp. Ru71]